MDKKLTLLQSKKLFAELYQICGALNCNSKILDNLSAASRGLKPPHKSLLPFYPDSNIKIVKDAN